MWKRRRGKGEEEEEEEEEEEGEEEERGNEGTHIFGYTNTHTKKVFFFPLPA